MENASEETPLVPKGSGGRGDGARSSSQGRSGSSTDRTLSNDADSLRKPVLVLTLVLVLILGPTLFLWIKNRPPTEPEVIIETVTVPQEEPLVAYRPFCRYYTYESSSVSGTAVVVKGLVETSMEHPSQPWSARPCYSTTVTVSSPRGSHPMKADDKGQQETSTSASTTTTVPPLVNTFSAPDALLKVNFSNAVFSAYNNRSTPILGFGGAFTEASARNYHTLTQEAKTTLIELLFGASGLGYNIGRFHINSCDFSVESYSFDETDQDFELKEFDISVRHDVETGMIPMALRAMSVLKEAWGGGATETRNVDNSTLVEDGVLRLFASPWSPPAWMKRPTWQDKKHAEHAARMTYSTFPTCLRDGVGKDSRYAKAWARYFSKFLTSYKNLGLPIWAVTVQNEPEFAAPWEACAYTADTETQFVAHHLGPTLRKDHPNVKILAFDHNKDHIIKWAKPLLNQSSPSAEYISGLAYHWYAGGMQRALDGAVGNANLHRLQSTLRRLGVPNQLVLGSESCHCPTTGYAGGGLDTLFSRAERYAHTILADLAAGSNGWVDWNLILDSIGGPNHLGNLCEAIILAVPHRALDAGEDFPVLPDFEHDLPLGNVTLGDGRTREELNAMGIPAKYLDIGLAVQPMYYYMGHISRYVRPGSLAVSALVDSSPGPGRTFRPVNVTVNGGGLNNLALAGIELTVWPCEGSTRQQFQWNAEGQQHILVYGHDWQGNPIKSCIGRKVDRNVGVLKLVSCSPGKSSNTSQAKAGAFDAIPLLDDDQGRFNIILRSRSPETCLVIQELENEGGAYGPRGGAPVTLGDCSLESAKWKLNEETGEASSFYFANDKNGTDNSKEVCLTTGWPFLQMGAFLTPQGKSNKTVVILNEATDSANYALEDENGVVLTGSVAARSIQTFLLE